MVIAFFLLILGLMMWVFPDYSILDSNYATLAQLFELGPFLLTFLIPAITMRTFAEEKSSGTIEFLSTKPLRRIDIIGGKYLASLALVAMAIIPTFIYVYSISQLGSPVGNIDMGEIVGSYIGLYSLAAAFTALGLFASSIADNQISAFLIGVLLCFVFYWGMDLLSSLPIFFAYFISLIGLVLVMTDTALKVSRA